MISEIEESLRMSEPTMYSYFTESRSVRYRAICREIRALSATSRVDAVRRSESDEPVGKKILSLFTSAPWD